MVATDRIAALARPLLGEAGLRLWDVEMSDAVLRVLVDRDGGVDLDALTEASRVVSALLDEHDDLVPAAHYELEVSSPGIERTLRLPGQYEAYVGTTVTVKTSVAVAGARRHRGVLTSVDGSGIELLTDTAPASGALRIGYDQIQRTRTVPDWGPTPRPGSRPKTAPARSDTAGATAATGPARDLKDRA